MENEKLSPLDMAGAVIMFAAILSTLWLGW